jgi:MFS family permease
MLDLAVLSVFGFSGYAALLATAPLWAVNGGATAAGSGLVNGVLLAATVLSQLAVPRALASWGTGRVLVAGLLLLGVPAPGYLLSDGLGWVLALSAVRGLGFGILTVVGSAVAAHLVPAGRRGAAIGVYGLAVAVPNLLLLPVSVPVVDRWGFAPVFWAAALPVLGVPPALRLARVLRDTGHDRPVTAGEGSPVRLRPLSGVVPPTVVLFSVTMAGGAVLTFAPQLTDSATAALVLLIMGITAALSRWLIGALADRRGARPFLAPILTCAGAAMAVCAWAVAREQRVVLIAAATVLGLLRCAAKPHSDCGVRRRLAAATAGRERRLEHWLRHRDGVRRRPCWCTRNGVFLPRRPRGDGRVLPPYRRRSCDRPLSPADHPSLAVGTGVEPREP